MKPSEVLFDLIRSLSKGEKRNFKLLAQIGSGSKAYIRLFDLIDRQSVYDEAKLVRQYKKIQPTGQFSVAKNYLYKSIIKSLVYFDKSDRSEQSSLIQEIRTLMGKRLYKHAQKQLKKAKDQANFRESFDELLVLFELEEKILFRTEKIREFEASVKRIEFEQKVVLEKITNLAKYRELYNKINVMVKIRVIARNPDEERHIDEILSHPLMENPMQALSMRAKIAYHAVLYHVNHYLADHKTCLVHTRAMLDLFEARPELRPDAVENYLFVFGAHSVLHFKTQQYDEGFRMMAALRDVEVKSPQEKVLKFEKYYQTMLSAVLQFGVDEKGLAFMDELQEELASIEGTLEENFKLIMYFWFSQFYLQVQDYKQSLKWINQFLNMPKTNLRDDLQCMARIVNLVIHYELGNYELVDYSLKSTYRFIFKRNRMNKYEKAALRYMKKLIQVPESEKESLLYEFKFTLENIFKDDKYEVRSNAGFDMVSWIESKLRKCSLAEVKRSKVREPAILKAFRL